MKMTEHEGAFLDPGIQDVHDYLTNVILDVAVNYEVDGIHLDYVRYPEYELGYNPLALDRYERETQVPTETAWLYWRQRQVSRLVARVYAEVKAVDPDIAVTTSVKPDIRSARSEFGQNWMDWIERGIVDYVYLMAYTTSDSNLEQQLDNLEVYGQNERIVCGLRAWMDRGHLLREAHLQQNRVGTGAEIRRRGALLLHRVEGKRLSGGASEVAVRKEDCRRKVRACGRSDLRIRS